MLHMNYVLARQRAGNCVQFANESFEIQSIALHCSLTMAYDRQPP